MHLLYGYLIVVSILIIVGMVEWVESSGFVRTMKQFQPLGLPLFLLAVYLSPIILVMEMVVPGFLNDLRPLIFREGQFAKLPGPFHRSCGLPRTDI